ncbi:hypothetical protein BG000_003762 [Podila horticola]|nr:hypothetical protein BG000_003762 [Podila horticola]
MLHRLLYFPHIIEAITKTFLFKDLLHCALVNRAWNDAVSPVLYLDVITYRLHLHSVPEIYSTRYTTVYFVAPESFQALHKHARHVRAITYKGASSLLAILEAGCSGLLEVNYISDQQDRELSLLSELVSQNPNLCAVSIEELDGDKEGQLERLQRFVTFLGDYPKIACFYVEANRKISGEVQRRLMKQRLDMVNKESVKCVSFVENVPRSERSALSKAGSRHFWSGRETPIMGKYSEGLEDKWSNGRFDRDINVSRWCPLAVLMKGEILEVPYLDFEAGIFIDQFPRVRQIRGHPLNKCAFPNITKTLELREVDLCSNCWRQMGFIGFLHGLPSNLSAVHMHMHDNQDSTGITQNLSPNNLSSPCTTILECVPKPAGLFSEKVFIKGSGPDLVPDVSPLWASRNLRRLRLGFWLEGHPNDAEVFGPDYASNETIVRSLASAKMIAPSFMTQLGDQKDLRHLDLSFNSNYRCGTSPFLQLASGPPNGLGQLSKLHRLEYFSVTGLLHRIGTPEIAWMSWHWSRLKKIQLPIFDAEKKTELHTGPLHSMVLPNYRACFQSLEVVKISGLHGTYVNECHGRLMCKKSITTNDEQPRSPPSRLPHLLVGLMLESKVSMDFFLQALSICPHPREVDISHVVIMGAELCHAPETSPPWASTQFKKLRVGIYLEGFYSDCMQPELRQCSTDQVNRVIASAAKLAPSHRL